MGIQSKKGLVFWFDRHPFVTVFLLCAGLSALVFLPSVIRGGGMLTVVSDFNHQQIVFHLFSNQSVKNGEMLWDWYTDLGGSFIGNYGFYTLGSPFFWLSCLFPSSAVPYLMAPLLVLKYGTAGLTAFAYIRRFVRRNEPAVLAALFYTFSGFQAMNLLFNHFHDVTALFPLLLIGLEELMEHRRPGVFACAVALNAFANFFFFIGEVVFIAVYFLIRFVSMDLHRLRRAGQCLWEGALGVGVAAVLFLPCVLFTMQNPRASRSFHGLEAFLYSDNRYLQLLKALFLPADAMNYNASVQKTDYASCSLYLPMTGLFLVVLFLLKEKGWLRRMLAVCFAIAFVPVLNSLFYAFNASYYARWFYMPILMMALAGAVVIDEQKALPVKKGLFITGGGILFLLFLVLGGFFRRGSGFVQDQKLLAVQAGIALAGVLASAWLISRKNRGKRFFPIFLSGVLLFSFGTHLLSLRTLQAQASWQHTPDGVAALLNIGRELELPPGEDYRCYSENPYSNLALLLRVPTVTCWNSTVCGSAFEFYEAAGLPRGIKSEVKKDDKAVKALLAVRYDILQKPDYSRPLVAQYENGSARAYVYENPEALPMGFAYDRYITRNILQETPREKRPYLLLKAMVVEEEALPAVRGRLSPLSVQEMQNAGVRSMETDIQERGTAGAVNFRRDTGSFSCDMRVSKPEMAFFSVPYDSGWKANVNGRPVEIIKTAGMMSVPLDEGNNHVTFTYRPPALILGAACSAVSILTLGLYVLLALRFKKRKENKGCQPCIW